MKCNVSKETLVDYFYGELEGEELMEFKKHAASCKDCTEELKMLELPSAATDKWEVEVPNLNMVFVQEKVSGSETLENVKSLFGGPNSFKPKQFNQFTKAVVAVAATLLFISVLNFELSYTDDGGFKFSTSLFGKSDTIDPVNIADNAEAVSRDIMTQQLLQSQAQMMDVMTQVLSERDKNQQDRMNIALVELYRTIQAEQQQGIQNIGMNFQDFRNQVTNSLVNTNQKFDQLVKTVGAPKGQNDQNNPNNQNNQ